MCSSLEWSPSLNYWYESLSDRFYYCSVLFIHFCPSSSGMQFLHCASSMSINPHNGRHRHHSIVECNFSPAAEAMQIITHFKMDTPATHCTVQHTLWSRHKIASSGDCLSINYQIQSAGRITLHVKWINTPPPYYSLSNQQQLSFGRLFFHGCSLAATVGHQVHRTLLFFPLCSFIYR